MLNKTNATKLVIEKNNTATNRDGMFVWRLTFYNGEEKIRTHIERLDADEIMRPVEFKLDEWLDHKLHCCYEFDKDTLIIEEVVL